MSKLSVCTTASMFVQQFVNVTANRIPSTETVYVNTIWMNKLVRTIYLTTRWKSSLAFETTKIINHFPRWLLVLYTHSNKRDPDPGDPATTLPIFSSSCIEEPSNRLWLNLWKFGNAALSSDSASKRIINFQFDTLPPTESETDYLFLSEAYKIDI